MANLPQEVQGVLSASAAGTSGYNPAWYALANTGIAWDPANATGIASDDATGAPGAPVLTFAEIVRRFGSPTPVLDYGANCIVNQGTLATPSAQPALQDEVWLEPIVSGGGQSLLNVALASAGADFLSGAVGGGYGYAAAVPAVGGTMMTIAAPPGYVVAGTLLENSSKGLYAYVHSVGGGTAKLTAPQTKVSLQNTTTPTAPATATTWLAGDNIKAWTPQAVNLNRWSAKGTDTTAANKPSGFAVFTARIVDTSGAGTSIYGLNATAPLGVLSSCLIDCGAQLTSERAFGVFGLAGCMVRGFTTMQAGSVWGGDIGGIICDGIAQIINNAAVHTFLEVRSAGVTIGPAFSDGAVIVAGGSALINGIFFGSYTVNVQPGGVYVNSTGSTFVLKAALTSGALKLGIVGVGTGSSYTPGTGLWVSAIAITPASIDANSGLQDPITGARFCNAN